MIRPTRLCCRALYLADGGNVCHSPVYRGCRVLYCVFTVQGLKMACAEMLRSGTTCFNDMYYYPEESAEITAEVGMRAVIALMGRDKNGTLNTVCIFIFSSPSTKCNFLTSSPVPFSKPPLIHTPTSIIAWVLTRPISTANRLSRRLVSFVRSVA